MSKTKRLLSLILAIATMFALFAGVSAFADDETPVGDTTPVAGFSDVTWANPYAEAIEVLAAAGIIKGNTDGTYGPKSNVTREQMAAFVSRSGLGAAKAETLLPADSGFTDVSIDSTMSKYIAWCVSENAINGKGNGTFDPTGNVTGVEVLKMLEGILNVDKVTELTGSMWATNTISYAIKLGLTDDVAVEDYNAPATREQVAQYVMNAIESAGYDNVGYGTSVTGWHLSYGLDNDYTFPLYKVQGLSRRQTENTNKTDDGTVNPERMMQRITPYGELYYRWEYATNGRGITSWRHDDKNEKIISTVVANPTTTGMLATMNPEVFKVYINGAVVSAVSSGTGTAYGNNRYQTNEYLFDPTLASTAFRIVCGDPNTYGQVTNETWTGAEIKIYEQRLSGSGVYDPVTGRYGTGASEWETAVFDGKADKIVVSYEYLGEVAFKSTANGVTTYEVDIIDAVGVNDLATEGRSKNVTPPGTYTAKGLTGSYSVGDYVRITPNLAMEYAMFGGLDGAYREWFTGQTVNGVTHYTDNATLADPINAPIMDNRFNYVSFGSITVLDHAKADTTTITPTNYGYAWKATGSTQTAISGKQGMYISAYVGSELTWLSGTYQEVLRAEKSDIYADGTRYTVFLDKNGYILGGFSQAGAEYAFLTSAVSNENALISTWRWISTAGSEPRSVAYFPGKDTSNYDGTWMNKNAFKSLYTGAAGETNATHALQNDVEKGVLRSNVSVNGDAIYAYVGDVVRVWGGNAKVLQGELTSYVTLPSDGKLYVEVGYDVFLRNFTFTQRSASDAATNFKRNAATTLVYRYLDDENKIDGDKKVVYVIVYASAQFPAVNPGYVAPRTAGHVAGGTSTATPSSISTFTAPVTGTAPGTLLPDQTYGPNIATISATTNLSGAAFVGGSRIYRVTRTYSDGVQPVSSSKTFSFSIGSSQPEPASLSADYVGHVLALTNDSAAFIMEGIQQAIIGSTLGGTTVSISEAVDPLGNGIGEKLTSVTITGTGASTYFTAGFTPGRLGVIANPTASYTLKLPKLLQASNTITITNKATGAAMVLTAKNKTLTATGTDVLANLGMIDQTRELYKALTGTSDFFSVAGTCGYTFGTKDFASYVAATDTVLVTTTVDDGETTLTADILSFEVK